MAEHFVAPSDLQKGIKDVIRDYQSKQHPNLAFNKKPTLHRRQLLNVGIYLIYVAIKQLYLSIADKLYCTTSWFTPKNQFHN